MNYESFGEFIKDMRINRLHLSVRKFADELPISFTYLSDVENGRVPAFKPEILKLLVEKFELTEDEKEEFYELAAITQNVIPLDITEKAVNNPELIAAFRKIIKNHEDKKEGD
jgi:transcriptional regulator with XRE-family HTH domain